MSDEPSQSLGIILLPAFRPCLVPFSSDCLVLGTLGLDLTFIGLPLFVQRCSRRGCLRGTCISVRARRTTQGVRLEIPCAPKREHRVLLVPRHVPANTFCIETHTLHWQILSGRLITDFFVLRPVKGVAPPSDGSRASLPSEFIRQNKDLLESAGAKGASVWNQDQLDSYGYWLTFDRHLSLRRLRQEAGFSEKRRPEEGWWKAFELFRNAGMIP